MKLKHVVTSVVLLTIFGMAVNFSIDSDTWWHLRAGQWMVENQQAIRVDHFSYTRAGIPWQYPGIWVQIAMYGIFNILGPGGLNIWVAVMVTAIFSIVTITVEGEVLSKAGLLLIAAVSSATYWAARPYLVTYLLFALSFLVLEGFSRTGKKNLWLLLPIMLLWVNSHGGFLAGFLLVGVYLAEALVNWLTEKARGGFDLADRWGSARNLSLAVAGMFGVSLLNPHGWEAWALPFSTVSRQAEQLFIAEWQSPDFHDPWMLPFALMLAATILLLGASQSRKSLKYLLLLAGFGVLGLISVRNIFFFAIIWPAAIYENVDEMVASLRMRTGQKIRLELSGTPTRIGKLMNWTLVFVVVALVAVKGASVYPADANQAVLAGEFPYEAVEFVKSAEPEGNVFNSYNYGGYLTWALPEYPVYVDGRADLYQDEIVLTWHRIINGSDERVAEFEKWDIRTVLIEPGMPLVEILKITGWEIAHQDAAAVVLFSP